MSDQYIVSARKYRPHTFDTVVGQSHITTTLKNAIRNKHLAHAYLFCGPRGVGKTSCARILARTINCEQPTADTEACGICPTCQSFDNHTSFNVFELDAASNNSVDDIRNLVDQVRFAPQQGNYKVYIIDEVHMLSSAAFNAFLKTLEEPPPYAIFILATTEKHKILPTILSRCQIFDFKRITTGDTVQHLQNIARKEGLTADDAALHVIAQKSEGCMRDALSMLDRIAGFTNGMLTYSSTMEHLNQLDADFYFRITDSMLAQDVAGTLLQLDQVLERGFEGDVIINGLAGHFRNLLLCKDARMAKLLDVPHDHKPVYHEKAGQAPPSFIISALHVINESELAYKNAANKRLHIEMCLIRLCYLLQTTSASANGEEKKNASELGIFSTPVTTNNAPAVTIPVAQPAAQTPEFSAAATTQHIPQPKPLPDTRQTAAPTTPPAPPVNQDNPVAIPTIPAFGSANNAPGGIRRINRNLLQQTDDNALKNKGPKVDAFTAELARELFEQYKNMLKAENRGVLHAQFSMMKIERPSEEEVRIISPSSITDTYAQSQRNDLQDFIRKETGLLIRITTTVVETEVIIEEKMLSKPELFEEMAGKNPSLLALRDAIKLGLEY